jgi:hypothetical protein
MSLHLEMSLHHVLTCNLVLLPPLLAIIKFKCINTCMPTCLTPSIHSLSTTLHHFCAKHTGRLSSRGLGRGRFGNWFSLGSRCLSGRCLGRRCSFLSCRRHLGSRCLRRRCRFLSGRSGRCRLLGRFSLFGRRFGGRCLGSRCLCGRGLGGRGLGSRGLSGRSRFGGRLRCRSLGRRGSFLGGRSGLGCKT